MYNNFCQQVFLYFLISQFVYATLYIRNSWHISTEGRGKQMKRQESKEDYLEIILILKQKFGMVRSIDIVKALDFTKPSVSVAMKNLREKDFIIMDKEGYIHLTDEGQKIAECIYERHMILTEALIAIGVSEENARKDACRIEHDISAETFNKIKEHFAKTKQ